MNNQRDELVKKHGYSAFDYHEVPTPRVRIVVALVKVSRGRITTFAVDLKTGVVVVRDVPAFVCTKCGDAWIDEPVVAKLEDIVADARRKHAVVEVTQWQQVAA